MTSSTARTLPTRGDAQRETSERATAKRRNWAHRAHAVTFVDGASSPADVPDVDGTVMICGEWVTPAGAREWLAGASADVYDGGHHPVVRLHGGPRVMAAAAWFGATPGAELCDTAWRWLTSSVERAWRDNPPGALAGSPGTVGRDLWLRSLGREAVYPVLSDEQQAFCRAAGGQGRVELFGALAGAESLIDGLYGADMRMAYAAVLGGMPAGDPMRVPGRWWTPDAQQRYRLRAHATIPKRWRHVGLLPVRAGTGWSWPAEPGRTIGPEWWDGAEVELAAKHGWTIHPHEAIVWPDVAEPFRTWRDRLVRILRAARTSTAAMPELYPVIRAGVRAMILHTVGAMHGAPYRVAHETAAGAVPADAELLGVTASGTVRWVEHRAPAWPECSHPEWSTHVWARARRRLLESPGGRGVLAVPRAELVAVRTDAVYTSAPMTWLQPDNGDPTPGRWVPTHADMRRQPRPRSHAELLRALGGR